MSRTVYAIASGKGGVGKTTTAVNLGAALAADGNEVVVVDADLGMANLAGFLEFEGPSATLHDVLADEADLANAVYAAPGDVDVVPSSTDIEAFARAETANLRGVVATLREEYDYVLLDTGAGISHDTVLPLGLADEVLLVSTPDVASVSDAAKTADLSDRVGTPVAGAVLNKRSNNILDADDVEETLGTAVVAVVPADEAVPTSIDAGRPLSVFAPTSPAALVYDALASVLTAEDPAVVLAEHDAADDAVGSDAVTADAVPVADSGRPEAEGGATGASPDGPSADALVASIAGERGEDVDAAGEPDDANEVEEPNGAEDFADADGADPARDADGAADARGGGDSTVDPSPETADARSLIESAEESTDPSPSPTASERDEGSSGSEIDPDSVPFAADDTDATRSALIESDEDADAETESNAGLFGRLSGIFSR